MTFAQLKAFSEVARLGSVRAAAASLVVTEPSVSAAIGTLEKELGVELLERHGRGVRLTSAGAELARHAAQIVGSADTARRRTVEAATGVAELKIGAVTTAAEFVLPPYLKRFRRKHPSVHLWMEVGNREEVFHMLSDRRIDVAIGGRPPESSGLSGQPFSPNQLIVVGATDHPLASKKSIDPSALTDQTWLMREPGSGTRSNVEEFFSEVGVVPGSTMTLGSNGAVKQAAALGLGIALVSADSVKAELSSKAIARLKVKGTPLERAWHAVWHGDPSPGVASLLRNLGVRTPE